MNLEVEDIIELLQNVLSLLKKYDNYNIAFIHYHFNKNKSNSNFCYLVKDRQCILAETNSMTTKEVNLSIEEPMIINAFVECLKDIWDHIAPVNKEKNEIIAWLQSHINSLKKSIKI